MKPLLLLVFVALVGLLTTCESKMCGCDLIYPTDTELVGVWQLARVTYGLTQTTVTPTELGYDETIEYRADGTFQRLRVANSTTTSNQEENGKFYTGTNPSKTADKQAIFYSQDGTIQPYHIDAIKLYLYERGGRDGTIADGSTYEYIKQLAN